MSCGQIALEELGIPITAYYASETDKFAIKQTQSMFPRTKQIGDVRNVRIIGAHSKAKQKQLEQALETQNWDMIKLMMHQGNVLLAWCDEYGNIISYEDGKNNTDD